MLGPSSRSKRRLIKQISQVNFNHSPSATRSKHRKSLQANTMNFNSDNFKEQKAKFDKENRNRTKYAKTDALPLNDRNSNLRQRAISRREKRQREQSTIKGRTVHQKNEYKESDKYKRRKIDVVSMSARKLSRSAEQFRFAMNESDSKKYSQIFKEKAESLQSSVRPSLPKQISMKYEKNMVGKISLTELITTLFYTDAFTQEDTFALLSSFSFYDIDPVRVLLVLNETTIFTQETTTQYIADVRKKYLTFIKYWISCCVTKEYTESHELVYLFARIVDKLKDNGQSEEADHIFSQFKKKLNRLRTKKPSKSRSNTARIDHLSLQIVKEGSIYRHLSGSHTLESIAFHLTMVDNELYRAIPNEDFVSMAWANDKNSVPSIVELTERFNLISSWVATEIILEIRAKEQKKITKFFMLLAMQLKEMRNYNALFAIVAAFNSYPLSRLEDNLFKSSKMKSLKKELTEFISHNNNYSKYRVELADHQFRETVPYIPLLFHDMIMLKERSCGGEYLDAHQMIQVGLQVINFKGYKKKYHFKTFGRLETLVRNLPSKPEEELENILKLREIV